MDDMHEINEDFYNLNYEYNMNLKEIKDTYA